MDVDGAIAVVTGGLSGLGAGAVKMLVERGGRVAILDRGPARDVPADHVGRDVLFLPTDVADPEQVAAAFARVREEFGHLDVCVNSAGIAPSGRVLSRSGRMLALETFRDVVEVNLIGLFDVTRHAAQMMSRNDPNDGGERGVIINVSSIAAFDGPLGQSAYVASKAGVAAMTLSLARDLGPVGIRVMTISPGVFDTGMLAMADDVIRRGLVDQHVFPPRAGRADEFAQLVATIIANPMLNGSSVRLDAAARLVHVSHERPDTRRSTDVSISPGEEHAEFPP
jgi:3-hydroxyacyl-CoA dehydrogenase/3-hydroxy-2-methylbutyryl-CoA dehydrogenase